MSHFCHTCFSSFPHTYRAILDVLLNVASGILHLHENDVLHSDIKADNIMLKSTRSVDGGGEGGRGGVRALIADFGLSLEMGVVGGGGLGGSKSNASQGC